MCVVKLVNIFIQTPLRHRSRKRRGEARVRNSEKSSFHMNYDQVFSLKVTQCQLKIDDDLMESQDLIKTNRNKSVDIQLKI